MFETCFSSYYDPGRIVYKGSWSMIKAFLMDQIVLFNWKNWSRHVCQILTRDWKARFEVSYPKTSTSYYQNKWTQIVDQVDFDLAVTRTIDVSDRTRLNPRMLSSGMLPIVIEVLKPEVQDLTVEKSAAETMTELLHNPTPMQGKLHTDVKSDPTIEEKKSKQSQSQTTMISVSKFVSFKHVLWQTKT